MEWNEENDVQPEQPVEQTEEIQPVSAPEPEPAAIEPEPQVAEPEPDTVEPEPEPEKASLLKKEISFRRKPKDPAEAELDTVEPEPEKSSMLKKEISFRRKPKTPKAASEPKAKTEKAPKQKGAGLKKEIS